VIAWLGGVHPTTTYPLDGACGTLARTTGAFLPPRFFTAAGNLTPTFGVVSSQAGVCHLAHVSLVH